MSDDPHSVGGRLDLDRRRSLGELLSVTLTIYRAHVRAVLACTSIVVVVVSVIEGIGLDQITGPYVSQVKEGPAIIQYSISFLVLMPLVNAMLALVLADAAAGRPVVVKEVVARALELFAPALAAALMYAVALVIGLSLIVPSIYILVIWFFATQAVVIDGRRGFGALARSAELVHGNWFRMLGTLLVILVVFRIVPTIVVGFALDAAASAANAQFVVFVGNVLFQIVTLSFVALASGLLFFQLRAARAAAPLPPRGRR